MCGGAVLTLTAATRQRGLSPRVRGSPVMWSTLPSTTRSIPACAGEPVIGVALIHLAEVYPRVCGGAALTTDPSGYAAGLSPRVRGSRDHVHDGGGPDRSIPACAGEPAGSDSSDTTEPVYPRVCGGAPRRSTSANASQGLSPRVRGSQCHSSRPAGTSGSIPACAGEPSWRVRGSLHRSRSRGSMDRSIPACAGEPHFGP